MYKTKKRPQKKYFPIIGQKFAMLTLIEIITPCEGINYTRYLCRCECGEKRFVTLGRLYSGRQVSCGCKTRGRAAEMGRSNRLSQGNAVENAIVSGYKYAAKKRGLDFLLSASDCNRLFLGNCVYCGVPPSRVSQYNGCIEPFTFNGIDRVDNGIGYTIGNSVSCCTTCNKAKNNMTLLEFTNWVSRVYNNLIVNHGTFIP